MVSFSRLTFMYEPCPHCVAATKACACGGTGTVIREPSKAYPVAESLQAILARISSEIENLLGAEGASNHAGFPDHAMLHAARRSGLASAGEWLQSYVMSRENREGR